MTEGRRPRPIVPDLPGIAGRLLAMALEWFGDGDLAPKRSFRSVGVPTHDLNMCPSQLTLWIGPGQPGLAGQPTTGRVETSPSVQLRTYMFTFELARCVPVLQDDLSAPSEADLDAAGAQALADYRSLDRFIASLGVNGKIKDGQLLNLGAKEVAAGGLSTVGPQGGVAAVRAAVSVTI